MGITNVARLTRSLFLVAAAFACYLQSVSYCLQCACKYPSKGCVSHPMYSYVEDCTPKSTRERTACFFRAIPSANRTGGDWSVTSFRCLRLTAGSVHSYAVVCEGVHTASLSEGCCKEDYCNHPNTVSRTLPSLPPVTETATETEGKVVEPEIILEVERDIAIAVSVVGVIVCIAIILLISCQVRRRRLKARTLSACHHRISETPGLFMAEGDSGFGDGGSSRGDAQLEERTISREIILGNQISKGRFGEVYRGLWRGNDVAVKMFQTKDEESFFREIDLFNTNMLRHNNIVGFQAADNIEYLYGAHMGVRLLMVLDYHSNGSLYDYLCSRTAAGPPGHDPLPMHKALELAASAAAGVAHLHFRIGGPGTFQSLGHKPSIAHRDLKTKNILVKKNGVCCIADLGMAVRDIPGDLRHITNLKAGTRRYMAPEILDGSINMGNFESFRQVDMYAFGIVLWEILSCCHLTGHKEPHYRFPFEDHVCGDPSLDDMFRVVCSEEHRPAIPQHWDDFEELRVMSRILRSCWKAKPSSRLSATNVSKKVQALLDNIKESAVVDVPDKNNQSVQLAFS